MFTEQSAQHGARGRGKGAELGPLEWKTMNRRFLKTEESSGTSDGTMSSDQEQHLGKTSTLQSSVQCGFLGEPVSQIHARHTWEGRTASLQERLTQEFGGGEDRERARAQGHRWGWPERGEAERTSRDQGAHPPSFTLILDGLFGIGDSPLHEAH